MTTVDDDVRDDVDGDDDGDDQRKGPRDDDGAEKTNKTMFKSYKTVLKPCN